MLLHDDRDILSQLPPATPADLQMEELTGDRVQQGMDTEVRKREGCGRGGLWVTHFSVCVCVCVCSYLQCPGECDASDRGILRLSPSLSSAVAALTALDLSFNRLTSTQHIADMVRARFGDRHWLPPPPLSPTCPPICPPPVLCLPSPPTCPPHLP